MADDLLAGLRQHDRPEFASPPDDPLALLCGWLDEAVAGDLALPQAMILATVDDGGAPATRTVAVKRWDARGLTFGSGLSSRKARHLELEPRAAGTFLWRETLQQLNVSGRIEPLPAHESDALFAERPAAARAAAIASQQSEVLLDEPALRARAQQALTDDEVRDRPAGWGGYLLRPDRIEFWLGGPDRLHRRLEYTLQDDRWTWRRLQP